MAQVYNLTHFLFKWAEWGELIKKEAKGNKTSEHEW